MPKSHEKLMRCHKKYIAKQEYSYLTEKLEHPRTPFLWATENTTYRI